MRAGTIPPDGPDPGPQTTETEADQPASGPPRRRGPWRLTRERVAAAFIALGAALLMVAVALWIAQPTDNSQAVHEEVVAAVDEFLESLTPVPDVSALVYQAVLPSMVVVQTDVGSEEEGFGMGSGVVINGDGSVLTALHNVEGATEIRLGFVDGTITPAAVVAADPERDIAVLMPDWPPGLIVPATIGSSAAMRVGDQVFAVGHPLGLIGSLSAGEGGAAPGADPVRRGGHPGKFGRPAAEPARPGRRHRDRADQSDGPGRLHRDRVRDAHRDGGGSRRRAGAVAAKGESQT